MSEEKIINGRAIAASIQEQLSHRVLSLESKGIQPGLVFIRVGEDPASKVYVGMKEKMCERIGIRSTTKIFPDNTPMEELLTCIQEYNNDPKTHGILVQAPLPEHLSQEIVYASVSSAKDVDGFHPVNVGKLMLGDETGFVACTPAGVHELLKQSGAPTEGSEVVILGRGNIVGKPMASILIQRGKFANATVTVCHSRTKNIEEHCRRADILIAAMGVPEFVKGDMVKPGATVIDVGVNRIQDPSAKTGSRLVGDIAFSEVLEIAGKVTPNPGGVGPMTIMMLMKNTIQAAENLGAT